MIHNLDITKWLNSSFTKWAALIDQMLALDWNQNVVNPAKVSACVAKLAASSLPRATASRITDLSLTLNT
jgi:hypothetical protein